MSDTLKYKVEIDDKNKNNSHSCIISLLEDKTIVLDVGCACGDMGRYLYDHKNCKVIGIDYDAKSVKIAEETGAYERVLRVDLNHGVEELDQFRKHFDYVVVGDVLEHLNNPKKVLTDLSKMIKDKGFMIVSVPNIAHGSVKINLLQNKFNYTEIGLLDQTHVRFFTKQSIIDLFESAKLEIIRIDEVIAPFEGTTENASTKSLPNKVVKFIENDHESYVYQYIVKACKKPARNINGKSDVEGFSRLNSLISLSRQILRNRFMSAKKRIKEFDERFLFSLISKTRLKLLSIRLDVNHKALRDYVSSIINFPNGFPKTYIEYKENQTSSNTNGIRAIAFYLPQFHPIPENDLWWGKGFTEWTNVSKAVPQFLGHYQPRLPSDLGFYDLRLPEIQKQQIAMAKNYGIYGFCFHYYWFSGKRLLERPIFQFLLHKEKEFYFPFCLCWANENWTRRWDASENLVLMPQTHHSKDDLKFIKDVEPFFKDSRYIKINGKFLLIVYRVHLFPKEDVQRMVDVWRKYCSESGLGELYLVCAQTHGFIEDPRDWGFDAAVEFPPHNFKLPIINRKKHIVNPNFSGFIYDFKKYFEDQPYLNKTSYTLFKTVFPEWDNTPRMLTRGHIFFGAGTDTYRRWLTDVLQFTEENYSGDEKIVFINAWNEWAEGACLEPDRRNGYSYLDITYDCLNVGKED